jgi:hypothetical protein
MKKMKFDFSNSYPVCNPLWRWMKENGHVVLVYHQDAGYREWKHITILSPTRTKIALNKTAAAICLVCDGRLSASGVVKQVKKETPGVPEPFIKMQLLVLMKKGYLVVSNAPA